MQLLLRAESFDGGLNSFIQNTAMPFAKIRQLPLKNQQNRNNQIVLRNKDCLCAKTQVRCWIDWSLILNHSTSLDSFPGLKVLAILIFFPSSRFNLSKEIGIITRTGWCASPFSHNPHSKFPARDTLHQFLGNRELGFPPVKEEWVWSVPLPGNMPNMTTTYYDNMRNWCKIDLNSFDHCRGTDRKRALPLPGEASLRARSAQQWPGIKNMASLERGMVTSWQHSVASVFDFDTTTTYL